MYAASNSLPEVTNPQDDGTKLRIRHALAGLQASVAGVLVMFAYLMVASLWHGRSIWVVPNLFSTTFFGSDAYRNQLLRTSWAGLAVTVAFYGLLGVLWGSILRDRSVRWLPIYGAVTGMVVYVVVYHFIWQRLNPLVTLYAPDRQLQLGHILWGLVLARTPLYARLISDSGAVIKGEKSPATPPPLPHLVPERDKPQSPPYAGTNQEPAEPEIKSGEVIL